MIYFDHNATTPIIPEVRDVMAQAMERYWGNPSSSHTLGRKATGELEFARGRLAELLAVSPDEIHFTSGGTEADNLALLGSINLDSNASIMISEIEHPAISKATDFLEEKGVHCNRVPVDTDGVLQVDALKEAITSEVQLISVMFANVDI